jgi:hypothetical protein
VTPTPSQGQTQAGLVQGGLSQTGLTYAYVVTVANAVFALATSFGLDTTADQQAAIITLLNVGLLGAAHLLRRKRVNREATP